MESVKNVCDLFFSCAEKFPARSAIIDRDDSRISFAELADAVNATVAYYRSKGIGKGDRVLVFIPMGIPLYRSILALFRIGAVAVFLDEWVSKERLELCCRLAHCKAFIASTKIRALALLSKELRKIPVWLGPDIRNTEQSSGTLPATLADNTALITFTTGSTGIPKAADRTHGFLAAQFSALVDKIRPQESDIDMPVLPIVLLLNLGTGVTSVIAAFNPRKPATMDAEKIWSQIAAHKVNRLTASPFVVEQLARSPFPSKIPMRCFTGGAPVFPSQAIIMKNGLPGSSVEIVYGSTEAEPISSISADELIAQKDQLQKGLAVGKPYHGTQVLILPVKDEAITAASEEALHRFSLPAESVGEITVSGNHVLKQYIDNPEAVKRNKIDTGEQVWHRTGDAGFLDTNGNLHLCGRCSSLIYDQNGKLLAPFLWEGWMLSLENVSMGTILRFRNKNIAVIETKGQEQKKNIRETILKRYPFDDVYFVTRIPRDPRHFSKIDYGKLNEQLDRNAFSA